MLKSRLLLILLCLPLIGFGQVCHYGSSSDATDLCDSFRGNNFSTNRNAAIALDKILSVTGMSKRFVLKECSDISNCVATSYKGIRYILYDKEFMNAIATSTNSWSSMSILAHEIGHHVNGHSLDLVVYAAKAAEAPTLSESRQMELEADEYSGFIMYKLGASLYQSQEAVRLMCTNADDSYSTHPKLSKRLAAIAKGYNKAKNQGSNNNDYSSNSSTLTAEDYFYKAYNNESDLQYQIDNYTKAIRVDPDYYPAIIYYNRGIAYARLGKYKDATDDFTRAIRIDPDDAQTYYSRGQSNTGLGNIKDAIDDFTRVIRIDSDHSKAYYKRGREYIKLGNYKDAIDDYTRAIRIDPDFAVAYYSRGIANGKLGNNNDAIGDYWNTIRIDPDYVNAYFNRGYTYSELGNYKDAIDDFTNVIRINPGDAEAYVHRGNAKRYLKLEYCRDFRRACDLGICFAYNSLCK